MESLKKVTPARNFYLPHPKSLGSFYFQSPVFLAPDTAARVASGVLGRENGACYFLPSRDGLGRPILLTSNRNGLLEYNGNFEEWATTLLDREDTWLLDLAVFHARHHAPMGDDLEALRQVGEQAHDRGFRAFVVMDDTAGPLAAGWRDATGSVAVC